MKTASQNLHRVLQTRDRTPASRRRRRWLPTQMIAMLVRFSITMVAVDQERDEPVHGDRGVGEIQVCLVEDVALVRAAVELHDHADAAQPFADHGDSGDRPSPASPATADRVAHDHGEDQTHHRYDRDEHPRELRVLRQREDDVFNHHGAVITMVSIMMSICCTCVRSVRRPGLSEAAELKPSNCGSGARSARAKIAPRRMRPKPVIIFDEKKAAADRARRAASRHQQHQVAGLENRALVAPHDPFVYDVEHQARQEERADRLCAVSQRSRTIAT